MNAGAGPRVAPKAATLADVPGIAALVARYWAFESIDGFDTARVEARLEALLGDSRLGTVAVAGVDGRVAGYVVVVHVYSLEHFGLTAEIDELYVDEPYRSSGAGAALLAFAERAAREAGCGNLSMQVGEDNHSALRFYRRAGFRRRSGFVLMEKDLEPGA